MRISDWSSDVCSSDLCDLVPVVDHGMDVPRVVLAERRRQHAVRQHLVLAIDLDVAEFRRIEVDHPGGDRKSVVEGKSVSVRVDLGGRRSIKKNTTQKKP